MTPQKTLREREKELQALLPTPTGRETLQKLGARYSAAGARMRPGRTSIITYILVDERVHGQIRD